MLLYKETIDFFLSKTNYAIEIAGAGYVVSRDGALQALAGNVFEHEISGLACPSSVRLGGGKIENSACLYCT
jgi:hypothetical protein